MSTFAIEPTITTKSNVQTQENSDDLTFIKEEFVIHSSYPIRYNEPNQEFELIPGHANLNIDSISTLFGENTSAQILCNSDSVEEKYGLVGNPTSMVVPDESYSKIGLTATGISNNGVGDYTIALYDKNGIMSQIDCTNATGSGTWAVKYGALNHITDINFVTNRIEISHGRLGDNANANQLVVLVSPTTSATSPAPYIYTAYRIAGSITGIRVWDASTAPPTLLTAPTTDMKFSFFIPGTVNIRSAEVFDSLDKSTPYATPYGTAQGANTANHTNANLWVNVLWRVL